MRARCSLSGVRRQRLRWEVAGEEVSLGVSAAGGAEDVGEQVLEARGAEVAEEGEGEAEAEEEEGSRRGVKRGTSTLTAADAASAK